MDHVRHYGQRALRIAVQLTHGFFLMWCALGRHVEMIAIAILGSSGVHFTLDILHLFLRVYGTLAMSGYVDPPHSKYLQFSAEYCCLFTVVGVLMQLTRFSTYATLIKRLMYATELQCDNMKKHQRGADMDRKLNEKMIEIRARHHQIMSMRQPERLTRRNSW